RSVTADSNSKFQIPNSSFSILRCAPVLQSVKEERQMKGILAPAFVILALVSAAAPLAAHHSWPVNTSRLVTVKGSVLEVAWENPHPMITIEVRADDGKLEKWTIGGPAISRMEANGWTRTTIKPGDVITGIGYQFANGDRIIRLERVVLADGRELRVYGR